MKKLDSRSVWMFFLGNAIGLVILIAFTSIPLAVLFVEALYGDALGTSESVSKMLGFIKVLAIFSILISYIVARLNYHFYRYGFTENGFQKEKGIIYKKYVTIPLDRIQNVDIHRSLLARIFGLSTIQIHTAGVDGLTAGEGTLPGLSKEDAVKFRDEILARARETRNTERGL